MIKREKSLQIRRWLNVWRQSEKYRRTNRLFISKTKENRRCKFNYEKVRRESLSKSYAPCENLHSVRKTTRIEEFRFCKSAESSFFSRNIFRNEERKTNFKKQKNSFLHQRRKFIVQNFFTVEFATSIFFRFTDEKTICSSTFFTLSSNI